MIRSLIEQWLPARTIGAESMRDASAAKKPPNSRLHVWWARRPLTASRAAILATVLPAWPTPDEAAEDACAAKVLAGLQAEFPGGEPEYRSWYLEDFPKQFGRCFSTGRTPGRLPVWLRCVALRGTLPAIVGSRF